MELEYEVVSELECNPPIIVENGYLTVSLEGKVVHQQYFTESVEILKIRVISYAAGLGVLLDTRHYVRFGDKVI